MVFLVVDRIMAAGDPVEIVAERRDRGERFRCPRRIADPLQELQRIGARHGGEQRFIDGKSWATQYARYTALALGRDTIRVDVAAYTIGY